MLLFSICFLCTFFVTVFIPILSSFFLYDCCCFYCKIFIHEHIQQKRVKEAWAKTAKKSLKVCHNIILLLIWFHWRFILKILKFVVKVVFYFFINIYFISLFTNFFIFQLFFLFTFDIFSSTFYIILLSLLAFSLYIFYYYFLFFFVDQLTLHFPTIVNGSKIPAITQNYTRHSVIAITQWFVMWQNTRQTIRNNYNYVVYIQAFKQFFSPFFMYLNTISFISLHYFSEFLQKLSLFFYDFVVYTYFFTIFYYIFFLHSFFFLFFLLYYFSACFSLSKKIFRKTSAFYNRLARKFVLERVFGCDTQLRYPL